MKAKERAQFLAIQNNSLRSKFLDAIGSEGSNARDMLNIDIDEIRLNKENFKLVKGKSRQINSAFIKKVRTFIKTDANAKYHAQTVIKNWIKSKSTKTKEDQATPKLKVA